ncbi:MAG: hypothetical protein U9M98_03605 [Patescibacteria group bacterium]|nr:hypothetical protein [Patescibacteria group bacterium]
MEKYLKLPQHYEDKYDLQTIEICIQWVQTLQEKLSELKEESTSQDIKKDKLETDWSRMTNLVIHSVKLERFKNRQETLDLWISEDKAKQDHFDNATPAELYCPECDVLMKPTLKTLQDLANKPLKVLFLHECPKCNYREGYFDNGQKYESTPEICEKCENEIKVSITTDEKEDKTIWKYACSGCDYNKSEVEDHHKWQAEREQEEKRGKELLAKYRSEFCFTEEEGNEAVVHMTQVANFMESVKEQEKKEADPAYQKAKQLEKLTVVELHELLGKALAKEQFINLQLERPEIGKYVVVPFTAQEANPNREEYDSRNQLKKLVKITLDGTNWKLMSDGVSYRVGYLSGRLRCYETEEDLVKIVK